MTAVIWDSNSLFARSWYAASADSGHDDSAKTIQFSLSSILNILNPDTNRLGTQFNCSLFAWDSKLNTSKHRAEKPKEYHETKDVLKDILTLMLGTVHYEHPEFEGDDIVATAVYKSNPKDTYFVVSGDKDLNQLQGGNCQFYCLNTKALLSKGFIVNKFGVRHPNQICIALAILGDKVDNIPGIRGWGPKKVQKLFNLVTKDMDFEQSLQAIDAQIPEIYKPLFYESLERTMLKTDVPGVPEPAEIVMATPEEIEALEIPEIDYKYRAVYDQYMVQPF